MMNRIFRKAVAAAVTAAAAASFAAPSMSASADWQKVGYIGDLNNDSNFTVADLVILAKYVLGSSEMPDTGVYNMEGAYYLTGVRSEITSLGQDDIKSGVDRLQLADIDQDGVIDTFDLIALRKIVIDPENAKLIYRWYVPEDDPKEHIEAPIYDLYGSLPSQGEAKVLAFSVDFPDLGFSYKASTDEVEQALFAKADTNSRKYPLESISAFYERSSKGAMHMSGKAYEYTAKLPISNYENDNYHLLLAKEVLSAFDEQIDYSDYDADNDGIIDCIMFIVPSDAGDSDWWPTTGIFGDHRNTFYDGHEIGHIVVGNKNITAKNDYSGFVSTYSHELGHAMGLPDYYLYKVDDFQGMHGSGGFELMDDAIGDFGAASKLMLGWYFTDQINVFDPSKGEQTFVLRNSETDSGNCVIIPRGTLADKYRSEFFILEYATLDNNNLRIKDMWWKATGSGVRIYHVDATLNDNTSYPSFLFSSGNDEATNYNKGKRFIRLVNEGDDSKDNLFRNDATIDGSTSGFMWYSDDGSLSTETGVTIYVKKGEDNTYVVTVKAN